MKKHLFLGILVLAVLGGCKKSDPLPVTEKCTAAEYKHVTIGTQVWMAENYFCSRYDTESEAYKAGRIRLSPTESYVYTPYYTDLSKIHAPEYMSTDQVNKVGYLYNWAAAVGVDDGLEYIGGFEGKRQGICPNGWHIPTYSDWETLITFIESTSGKGAGTAGLHLKSTTGWYDNGNGDDAYGFEGIASGSSHGTTVNLIGYLVYYWTDTPYGSSDKEFAYAKNLSHASSSLQTQKYSKDYGLAVRCLKN